MVSAGSSAPLLRASGSASDSKQQSSSGVTGSGTVSSSGAGGRSTDMNPPGSSASIAEDVDDVCARRLAL
jgi:hypothetical protein